MIVDEDIFSCKFLEQLPLPKQSGAQHPKQAAGWGIEFIFFSVLFFHPL